MKRAAFSDRSVLRVPLPILRARLLLIVFALAFIVLAGRALFLQGLSTEFLQQQGERRYERTLTLPADRGKILDRHDVVLASSIPAVAVWAIPEDARQATDKQWTVLGRLLDTPPAALRARVADTSKNFVYLKRQVSVEVAREIAALKMPGVHRQPETLRVYPESNVMAHIVGFTDIEGKGQEGVELAFDDQLAGKPGSRRVIRDRLGRVIRDVQAVNPPQHGRDLNLSIDTRLQYVAHKSLQDAMVLNKARAAAAVILDVRTGEILALANLPSYDPNQRGSRRGEALRNRVLTDTFEPGSIIKPFTAALALDLERISTATLFDTGDGRIRLYGETISDISRNGVIDVADVLRRSSNVGMTLIAERLQAQEMWDRFTALGLGQVPQTGFPGTAAGRLRPWERWRPIEKATMAYGYGLSASLLQMARAYTVFARDGDLVTLSLVRRQGEPASIPVYSAQVARTVRAMLEAAAGPDGAKAAQVQGYRVAGKSGTARKIVDGKYSTTRYRSSFVGFAPVSNPRVVVAVSIDEPDAGAYYGGRVAAPVFSRIVGHTLRLLGERPDAPFDSIVTARASGVGQ